MPGVKELFESRKKEEDEENAIEAKPQEKQRNVGIKAEDSVTAAAQDR